jgi:arginase
MKIQIIEVPYDSGHVDARIGLGPAALTGNDLLDELREQGHVATHDRVESTRAFRTEVSTAFELSRMLAERVRRAVAEGHFPLVLAGNCSTAIGTIAGLASDPIGIIWFDAHGDLNTPETTASGFFDGMALTVIMGRSWQNLAQTVQGFKAVEQGRVIMVGMRDLDQAEKELLDNSDITLIGPNTLSQSGVDDALNQPLNKLQAHAEGIYLHLDLDVLDPQIARANEFAAPDGLTVSQVQEIIRLISQRLRIKGAAITAYDPSFDGDGRTLAAAKNIIHTLIGAVDQ